MEKEAFSQVVKYKAVLAFMGHSLKVHRGSSRQLLEITEQRWYMLSLRDILPARNIPVFCTVLSSSVDAVCPASSDMKRLLEAMILLSSLDVNIHVSMILSDSYQIILVLICVLLIVTEFTVW